MKSRRYSPIRLRQIEAAEIQHAHEAIVPLFIMRVRRSALRILERLPCFLTGVQQAGPERPERPRPVGAPSIANEVTSRQRFDLVDPEREGPKTANRADRCGNDVVRNAPDPFGTAERSA